MKVLFVCTGNTCRSPMAEGILRKLAKEKDLDIEVKSSGMAVHPGGPAARNSIDAMKEINIDISDHKSTQLHRDLVEEAELILTMSQGHKHGILMEFPDSEDKVFNLLEYAYEIDKDLGDPFGGSLEIYKETRDEIYEAIKKIVDSL